MAGPMLLSWEDARKTFGEAHALAQEEVALLRRQNRALRKGTMPHGCADGRHTFRKSGDTDGWECSDCGFALAGECFAHLAGTIGWSKT